MQLDAGFARALRAGDAAASASTGLEVDDLELLSGLDPAAVSADPGGKRRTQIVGNVALEFTLSLSASARSGRNPELLEGFCASPEFHRAIVDDRRLPLAYGEYALRRANEVGRADLAAVIALEAGLAQLRRAAAGSASATPRSAGESVRLSSRARILDLPAGTHAWCEALYENGESAAAPAPPQGFPSELRETVLLFAHRVHGVHRPAEVRTELLNPPVDELLRRAQRGLSRDERADFARSQAATPDELENFLASFLEEGVLERGA